MYLRTLEICLELCELDPAKFLSGPGLPWQAILKKTKVELVVLTDIDMLLMVEKDIRDHTFMTSSRVEGGGRVR